MRRFLLAISTAAFLLFMGAPPAQADESPELSAATGDLVRALGDMGVTVSISVLTELTNAGEQLAREHLEPETWHGAAIEPDEVVVCLKLALYAQAKGR